ncbi:MAG: hypothetical protein MPJ06_08220 [Nitrosopumilus sp.]|nr:hypothetical protein [Nitrosopumilus sp.]
MHILDASAVISICDESNTDWLLDRMLDFDDTSVPMEVYCELEDEMGEQTKSGRILKEYHKNGKIQFLTNTPEQIRKFEAGLTYEEKELLAVGEKGVMIAYENYSGDGEPCCVLDDGDAVEYARTHGLVNTNTGRLMEVLLNNNKITEDEYRNVMKSMGKPLFR